MRLLKKEKWLIKLNQVDKTTIQTAKKLVALEFILKVEIKKEVITIHTISGLCQLEKEPFINQLSRFFFEKKKTYSYFQIPINLQNNASCQNKKCLYTSCPIIIAAYFWYNEKKKRKKKEEKRFKEEKEGLLLEKIEHYQLMDLAENYKKLITMLQSRSEQDRECRLSLHYYINASTINRAYDSINLLNDILYEYKVIEYKLPMIDIKKVLQGEQEWVEYSECIFLHMERLVEYDNSVPNQSLGKIKNQIIDFLEKNINQGIFIIIDLNHAAESFLKEYPKLQLAYAKKYNIPDLSAQSITNYVLTMLHRNKYECEPGFEKQLYQYIYNNYKYSPFHNFEYGDYLYNAIIEASCYSNNKQVLISHLPSTIEAAEPATLAVLNQLIGLNNVKKEVQNLREFLIYNQKIKAVTKNTPVLNLHMMFLGNPGTGKTTVARLIAQLLYELGYIRTNKVIEADKKTFTGQYVGQSTVKTKEVLEKAMGGVLFIDEAYALGERGSFNEEIVATIIKVMEDSRDELIIIFAGYTKSMQQFFAMNEGLRSRIGRTLYFEDYTAKELTEIAVKKLKDIDYTIAPEGETEIEYICEAATKQSDFGNGRFADLLVQKIIRSHASLYQDGEDILYITKQDILHAKDLL